MIRIVLLGLLVITCCQAIWPFDSFHSVGNKRLLEPKNEMDAANVAQLAKRLADVEKSLTKFEKETRAKFDVVEKELLKVTATNRNFRLFAERFASDKVQQRETPNCKSGRNQRDYR